MPQTTRGGTVAADGTLTLPLRASGALPWIVSQVSPEMKTGADLATGVVRFNGSLVAPFVPAADAVGGSPPVTLQPGSDTLTVEWTGATPGSIGQALFIYDLGTG